MMNTVMVRCRIPEEATATPRHQLDLDTISIFSSRQTSSP